MLNKRQEQILAVLSEKKSVDYRKKSFGYDEGIGSDDPF